MSAVPKLDLAIENLKLLSEPKQELVTQLIAILINDELEDEELSQAEIDSIHESESYIAAGRCFTFDEVKKNLGIVY